MKNISLSALVSSLSAVAILIMPLPVEARPIPSDAGWINVKNYGAIGNGTADDTQAIRDAFAAGKRLYFPDGVYRITDQIILGTTVSDAKHIFLEGESQAGTIIRLSDANTNFQDPANPKPMISFYEGTDSGGHQDAFRNTARDLTFSVGKDNPGACGLRFTASNQGGIENVTIVSEPDALGNRDGVRGLDLTKKDTGPQLYKNITIDGFDYAVRITDYGNSSTWENATFMNQKTTVISNVYTSMFFRHVTSTSPVKFYADNGGNARLVLVDSTISGTGTAISTGGHVFLRNVTATGWTKIVDRVTGTDITDPAIVAGEYSTSAAVGAFTPVETVTLNLPISETPTPPAITSTNWVRVPNNAGDDTQAIRDAITTANSQGKTGIYFVGGQIYDINDTINITGGIRHVVGYEANLRVSSTLQGSGKAVFRFTGLTGADVTFERFNSEYPSTNNNFCWFEHDSSKNVALRRIMARYKSGVSTPAKTYRTGANGTGKLFVEDVSGNGWRITNQPAYFWQINPESRFTNDTNIVNDGGTVWILGLKMEGPNTVLETKNAGKSELLGGFLAPNDPVPSTTPGFIVTDSDFSAILLNTGNDYGQGLQRFQRIVTETVGGTTAHYSATNPWFYNGYEPASGSIAVTSATASGNYNLTTEGSLDWAKWGRAAVSNFDHKATGGTQISHWTAVGTGQNRSSGSGATHTWTDGTPTSSASFNNGYVRAGGAAGRGFEFTAAAGTSTKTLKVYLGTQYSATGVLDVSLDDGSAAGQQVNLTGAETVVTIVFGAATSTSLRVRYTTLNATGNVVLRAASLQ